MPALTIENFSIDSTGENGSKVWQVFLDGVVQLSCDSEDKAVAFIEYVLKMELYKQSYLKYQKRIIEEFFLSLKVLEKKSTQSLSIS